MAAPLEIVEANERAEPGTFLHALHEESRFDEPAFWSYYNAIRQLAEAARASAIDRVTARRIVRTSQYALRALLWHFLPGDASRVADLDVTRLSAFVDRLTDVVDAYFAGYGIDETRYDDGLMNPET
jgi:hypothetical protein